MIYKVVAETAITNLEESVNALLAKGWRLHGDMIHSPVFYMQPMTYTGSKVEKLTEDLEKVKKLTLDLEKVSKQLTPKKK